MKKIALAVAALGAVAIASPASATVEVSGSPNTGCSNAPVAPSANQCAGYFDKNAFGGNKSSVALQQGAVDLLLGKGVVTVDWGALDKAGKIVSGSNLDDLNALLATAGGQVVLGFHWGNVPGSDKNVSAFYKWDNAEIGSIKLTNTGGYSNAVLYRATAVTAPVPEPGTWALMLVGFGAVGASMRRRRRQSVIPQFA